MQYLQTESPEKLGIPSSALEQLYTEIEKQRMPLHSFMLLRHGKAATAGWWSPYRPEHHHLIYSTGKSFVAMAVGLCIEQGLFSIDDKIIDFFPEKMIEPVHPFNASRTVRNLLQMQTGNIYAVDRTDPDWVKTFLNTVPPVMSGTLFGYDSTGTHTLCALIEKVTGSSLLDFMNKHFFGPMDIGGVTCQTCPMGINAGSRGFYMQTEQMAMMGQLWLQGGEWEGKQLMPRAFLKEATSKQVDISVQSELTDGNNGYGYQFWMLRDGAYAGLGSGSQIIIVIPALDIVWVSTGNLLEDDGNLADLIHLVWATVIPVLPT